MTVHVLGDSHTKIFNMAYGHSEHFVVKEWAWCVHNLYKKGELTSYILNKVNPEKDDLIFVFGEIDCRNHIYYQYVKRKGEDTISDIIDETISNYDIFLSRIQAYRFAVCNVVPAGRWANGWVNDLHWGKTSPSMRILIHTEFHTKLSLLCREKGYTEIDVWPYVIGPDGHAKREFTTDEVHLNGNAVPFVITEVEKALGVKLGDIGDK